jgi:hypothetical protein
MGGCYAHARAKSNDIIATCDLRTVFNHDVTSLLLRPSPLVAMARPIAVLLGLPVDLFPDVNAAVRHAKMAVNGGPRSTPYRRRTDPPEQATLPQDPLEILSTILSPSCFYGDDLIQPQELRRIPTIPDPESIRAARCRLYPHACHDRALVDDRCRAVANPSSDKVKINHLEGSKLYHRGPLR